MDATLTLVRWLHGCIADDEAAGVDPDRVESDRAVVDLHNGHHDCSGMDWSQPEVLPCPTLVWFARRYRARPGFDEAWRMPR